jgi:hypothetical protein
MHGLNRRARGVGRNDLGVGDGVRPHGLTSLGAQRVARVVDLFSSGAPRSATSRSRAVVRDTETQPRHRQMRTADVSNSACGNKLAGPALQPPSQRRP